MTEKLTIGKLADQSNVGVETIRFYERRGLLKQPAKKGSFRYYPVDDIARVQFVKRAQELGFTLKEVKQLLDLRIKDQAQCSDVLDQAARKINEIDKKINDLKKMKKSLLALADCCEDASIPLSACPILDSFLIQKKGQP